MLEAVAAGFDQYVILGAGFDTFAMRHPELTGRLAVFEVDHPDVQRLKRQRRARGSHIREMRDQGLDRLIAEFPKYI